MYTSIGGAGGHFVRNGWIQDCGRRAGRADGAGDDQSRAREEGNSMNPPFSPSISFNNYCYRIVVID